MLLFGGAVVFACAAISFAQQPAEAPAGFDGQSNGLVDQKTHSTDLDAFERVLEIADGLGPLYNAQSCRECHQNPVSGGSSQVTVLRVGHLDAKGHFQNPEIPINHGEQTVKGRSLINDRSICPDADSPHTEIQERIPDSENIRATHISLNLLGDGYVEAIPDQTFLDISQQQCKRDNGRICGQALRVPSWKRRARRSSEDSAGRISRPACSHLPDDAYLNEMGITTRLFPTEVEYLCNTVREPNEFPDANGLEHVDLIARFVRSTKVPARDSRLAGTPSAVHGAEVFRKDRLRDLPRVYVHHSACRSKNKWRPIHRCSRAGRQDDPSLRRFSASRRGNWRRNRDVRHGDQRARPRTRTTSSRGNGFGN